MWPLTFLTLKWCMAHHYLVGYICDTYKVIWSNKHRARERRLPRLWTRHVILNFLSENGATTNHHPSGHIGAPYKANCLNRKGALEQMQNKIWKINWTVTFGPANSVWSLSPHGCICPIYEANWPYRHRAMMQTTNTSNNPWNPDFGL